MERVRIDFAGDVDGLIVTKDARPGHAAWMRDNGGRITGLMFRCPRCNHFGRVVFKPRANNMPGGWDWDGNVEAPTVTPSILHDSKRCGWHGYLTAGEFVPCST